MPLKNIPIGIDVHNVELRPGQGGKMVRGAGNSAVVVAKDAEYVQLKLPSGEIRKFFAECYATIGSVGNTEFKYQEIGKAGRKRLMGIRPTVRGSAMNPVDHPYGGGEGRQGRGTRRPKTLWGKVTGGRKTRTPKKYSNQFIVSRRITGKKRKSA
jgi:large subunit ribosomal protein L2